MRFSPSASSLDAVTVDAMGTLVELDEPAPRLRRSWPSAASSASWTRWPRSARRLRTTFRARSRGRTTRASPTSAGGAQPSSSSARADLDPAEFRARVSRRHRLRRWRSGARARSACGEAGLVLACVSNWDVSWPGTSSAPALAGLHRDCQLRRSRVGKARPGVFVVALERLGVPPDRALHIGDGDGDARGAAAAGLAFEPVPLATLPERLGLGRRP